MALELVKVAMVSRGRWSVAMLQARCRAAISAVVELAVKLRWQVCDFRLGLGQYKRPDRKSVV